MQKYTSLLFSFLIALPLFAQEELEQSLEEIAINNNLIGLSVALTCGEDIQQVYHYGWRDIGQQLVINDSTRFRIASISKTITAVGLMRLYDQGLFELDDDISEYLGFEIANPNFPDQPITFRQVLSHRSGIRDGSGYSSFLSATYNQVPTPAISALVQPNGAYYTANIWNNYPPGTYFEYSNLNFGIVATLIERITQQRFDQYMKTEVLMPLEIGGSYNVQDIGAIDNIAVLYRNAVPQSDNYQGNYPSPLNLDDYVPGNNGILFAPQGGLRVSVIELSRLMRMLAQGGSFEGTTLLESTTVELMLSEEWSYNGDNGDNYYNLFNSWGLGIQRTLNFANGDIVLPGTTCYGHAGEAYGLISDMYFAPELDFGIIFMTNGYYGSSNYTFGNESAFYVPEEEAFAAINQWAVPICQQSTSQIDLVPEKGIVLFPNPTDDRLTVVSKHSIRNVTATDFLGRTILLQFDDQSIDTTRLLAGYYTIHIELENGEKWTELIAIL